MDRKKYSQCYTLIKDHHAINYIKDQYKLLDSDVVLSENKRNPVIMGSVTRFNACSMSSIATFNLCLDLPED